MATRSENAVIRRCEHLANIRRPISCNLHEGLNYFRFRSLCFIVFVGCVLASKIFHKTSDLGQILMKDSAPACVRCAK